MDKETEFIDAWNKGMVRRVSDGARPWVGLTGTEVNHIFAKNVGCPERMMKDVENLLKEKNT